MDNLSWDNPSTIRNDINIIPSCIWGSQFDHLQEPQAICTAITSNELAEVNSLDLQGIISPHDVAANFSKADLSFLQQHEEIMVGASSAGESTLASHDQLLPLPLMTSSYEDLQVIRNLQTFCSGCGSNASSSESEQHQHSPNPETTKGDNYQLISSKKNRRDYSDGGFRMVYGDSKRWKAHDNSEPSGVGFWGESGYDSAGKALAQLKEMIYRAAALQPVNLGVEEVVERPKRKNVRISDDPQTVAARHRRERISEKLRVLQKLVPGGSRMDTASMLGEAANYLKFLKAQVIALERLASMKTGGGVNGGCGVLNPIPVDNSSHYSFPMHASLPFFT